MHIHDTLAWIEQQFGAALKPRPGRPFTPGRSLSSLTQRGAGRRVSSITT
jgi:hypothetical protein